jgi:methionine-rich copper-binding protein CopC
MRITTLVIATVATLQLGMAAASAHAHLERAEPAVGSSVKTPPREVSIRFTQKLEPSFSTIEVTDASGKRVDNGRARITGNTMQVPLQPIGAGTYRVKWHALSVDSHTTEGDFTFRVGQ